MLLLVSLSLFVFSEHVLSISCERDTHGAHNTLSVKMAVCKIIFSVHEFYSASLYVIVSDLNFITQSFGVGGIVWRMYAFTRALEHSFSMHSFKSSVSILK